MAYFPSVLFPMWKNIFHSSKADCGSVCNSHGLSELCKNRGKVAFADSGIVLCYCIDQTLMLRFCPIWTFFRHTITWTLVKKPCIFDPCPIYCMPEEGPDSDQNIAWKFGNAIAKYCSRICESNLSTICIRYFSVLGLSYWLLRVSDLQNTVSVNR